MIVSATEGHPGLTRALRAPLVTLRWAYGEFADKSLL
jgi:hypothetical protein